VSEHPSRHTRAWISCSLALICLAVAPRFAHAGEVDVSGWECQLCAPANGWEIQAEAGTGYVADDEYYFGKDTGLDDSGFYPSGDVFARYRGRQGELLRIDGQRLGLDSRAISLRGGRQGRYTLRASYQGIPVRTYDTTVTPYTAAGARRLALPAGWVRAPSTQGMTGLDAALHEVNIKQDWDIYTAGLTLTPKRRWRYDADYRRIERNGRDIYAGSFFFNTAEFTRPIDYQTDELDVKLAYTERDWQLGLGYNGSYFNNDNRSLTWANAYSPQSPGQDSGQLALPPDNNAHQLTLSGAVRLPANTTVNGHVSVGRMKQDEDLLPYTTNGMIATAPLPGNSADARVDTTNVDLRAVSSPARRFTLEGRFRYDRRDNRTPERVYDYVVTDLAPAPVPVSNVAYDFDRYDYRLGGDYRIDSRTRLHAGIDHEYYKRSAQARNDTRTDTLSTRLDTRAFEFADVTVEVYAERRNGSGYDPVEDTPSPQNPLMRLYNLADRNRNGFKTTLSVFANQRLSLGMDFEASNDDYDSSPLGLDHGSYAGFGLDLSALLARNMTAYATTHVETSKSKQANSQDFSDPDWTGNTDDEYFTATLGLKYPGIIRNLGANLEYTYASSTGQITNQTNGLISEFPDLKTRFHQVRLGLEYPCKKDLSLKFGYLFQKYSADDWALDGVSPDTVPNLLSLGAEPQAYSNHVVFVGVKYLFDSRVAAGARSGQD
jgi:MtrB/PioB family decaheme-associated outer membrane protein